MDQLTTNCRHCQGPEFFQARPMSSRPHLKHGFGTEGYIGTSLCAGRGGVCSTHSRCKSRISLRSVFPWRRTDVQVPASTRWGGCYTLVPGPDRRTSGPCCPRYRGPGEQGQRKFGVRSAAERLREGDIRMGFKNRLCQTPISGVNCAVVQAENSKVGEKGPARRLTV